MGYGWGTVSNQGGQNADWAGGIMSGGTDISAGGSDETFAMSSARQFLDPADVAGGQQRKEARERQEAAKKNEDKLRGLMDLQPGVSKMIGESAAGFRGLEAAAQKSTAANLQALQSGFGQQQSALEQSLAGGTNQAMASAAMQGGMRGGGGERIATQMQQGAMAQRSNLGAQQEQGLANVRAQGAAAEAQARAAGAQGLGGLGQFQSQQERTLWMDKLRAEGGIQQMHAGAAGMGQDMGARTAGLIGTVAGSFMGMGGGGQQQQGNQGMGSSGGSGGMQANYG